MLAPGTDPIRKTMASIRRGRRPSGSRPLQRSWDDKLLDVTDVIDTQREEFTEAALLTAHCYNNVAKKRSFYGVPFSAGVLPNHIWKPLIEKAGYKIEEIPKTWDAFYDFFKEVQKKLRAQGVRNVYGLGFQVTTNGVD